MSTAAQKFTLMTGNAKNLWFSNLRPNPDATLRLFCVPYAGGGAQVFQQWPERLPSSIETWAVNLPGRGKRLVETPFGDLVSLVASMTEALLPLLNKPFALFGHSMGALIAYETACTLRRMGARLPQHLLVSGCFAPQFPDPHPIHHLPHEEFLRELRRLGGMPKEVLKSEELMELILPSLRADFTATEQYLRNDESPLPVAISVFGGWRDPLTTKDMLDGWRIHTTSRFSMRMLPGDHFFIHSAQNVLLDLIASELGRGTSPAELKPNLSVS
jgi:medium-chain acyl-[acyl-carrier-protein] hydrolase